MSIFESIGIIAAVGFGAARLIFGWRTDQPSKTAEQIAKDSNRIAEESKTVASDASTLAEKSNEIATVPNRLATEANEIARSSDSFQRIKALDRCAAMFWIGEPWVYSYGRDAAPVALSLPSEGKAFARDLSISVLRNGQPYGQSENHHVRVRDKGLTTKFPIHYQRDKSANPNDVYLLRFENRDELPELHTVEHCFRVSGIRNDERTEEWQFLTEMESQFC